MKTLILGEKKPRTIKSAEENPFYLENMFRVGATYKHIIVVLFLSIIFTVPLFYYLMPKYDAYHPVWLLTCMIFSLSFLIESLPLLAKHEIRINNKLRFCSSIYNLSFDRDKAAISFKNENNRKYLRLFNKRVLNTNLFALIMSNVLIFVLLICECVFLIVYAVHNITSFKEEILIGLLFLTFTISPYALLCYFTLQRAAHILISDNKHKIRIYTPNPEWLMEQLVRK